MINCKAKVQVTVEVDVTWCSTDKTVDEFFTRAAQDAMRQVIRGCGEFARVEPDARCVLVVGAPVTVTPAAPKETP